tara:strand:- start:63 stop:776 length:714 start_codon:yes stop_codon:yes gene_type:complete
MENYYKLLGLPKNAKISLIKSSFRKKAKSCHPDLFQNASEKELKYQQKLFVKLSQAYEILSDSKKRRIYDNHLKNISNNTQQTNDQKKQRTSSFSSKTSNLNSKNRFNSDYKKFYKQETEDSLDNLIDDIKKMMDQLEVKYRDPLEMLVEWAKKIFKEITEEIDQNTKYKSKRSSHKFEDSTNTSSKDRPFKNVEDELEYLKTIIKAKSKISKPFENKNFENEIDQELRSIKKKYRI